MIDPNPKDGKNRMSVFVLTEEVYHSVKVVGVFWEFSKAEKVALNLMGCKSHKPKYDNGEKRWWWQEDDYAIDAGFKQLFTSNSGGTALRVEWRTIQ